MGAFLAAFFRRILVVVGAIVAASATFAAEPPLAGCYERVYDAAHLAEHKGQSVMRARLAVDATKFGDHAGKKNPFVADAMLLLWVRGKDKSFDSIGACTAQGQRLACEGSLSAAEASTCRTKQDGIRQCRIDPGEAGSFQVEPKPDGVLVSIPQRLELLQSPYDGGPYLNFSSSNAENRAFLLKRVVCQ
jgi:hypothetical protein